MRVRTIYLTMATYIDIKFQQKKTKKKCKQLFHPQIGAHCRNDVFRLIRN